MPTSTVIRNRGDVFEAWDHQSVIIKQQAVGSTIAYPRLAKGITYRGFSLRDEYVLVRLRSIQEAVHWSEHNFYDYSVFGTPSAATVERPAHATNEHRGSS